MSRDLTGCRFFRCGMGGPGGGPAAARRRVCGRFRGPRRQRPAARLGRVNEGSPLILCRARPLAGPVISVMIQLEPWLDAEVVNCGPAGGCRVPTT